MTAIGCPVSGSILGYVEQAIRDAVPGLGEDDLEIDVTFDPPWNPDMVSDLGRELLKEVYGYDVVEEWKKRMAEDNQDYNSQGLQEGQA